MTVEYIKVNGKGLGCSARIAFKTDIAYDASEKAYSLIWKVIRLLEPSDWVISSINICDKYQRHELKCELVWSKDETLKRLKDIE